MTSMAASGIALLLYAVMLAPIALFALRSANGPVLGFTALAMIGSVAFWQTGALQRGQLASTDVDNLMPVGGDMGRCPEIIQILTDGGVILAPPTPETLTVRGAAWDQIPFQAQQVVLLCARGEDASNSGDETVEIIRR